MDCHDVSELISAYVDEELSDSELALVRTHLRDCEACQALVKDFQSISLLTRNALAALSAPEWIEANVMRQVECIRQSKQGFRLSWFAVCSAVAMTAVAIGGGLVAGLSFCWVLVRLMFHLVHGIHAVLLRMVIGQGWLVISTVIVAVVVTAVSMLGIGRVMRQPLDPRLGSS